MKLRSVAILALVTCEIVPKNGCGTVYTPIYELEAKVECLEAQSDSLRWQLDLLFVELNELKAELNAD